MSTNYCKLNISINYTLIFLIHFYIKSLKNIVLLFVINSMNTMFGIFILIDILY